jgi:hypothetical protein
VLITFDLKGQQVAYDMKKIKINRDFLYDYFPSILGTNFQSGLKIPFLEIHFLAMKEEVFLVFNYI